MVYFGTTHLVPHAHAPHMHLTSYPSFSSLHTPGGEPHLHKPSPKSHILFASCVYVNTHICATGVLYTTVVTAWAIVAAVGLGSEVTMGHTLMQYIAKNEHGVVIWHLAQMCFSLFLAVAFSAESGFGMPFLAAGLWKCDHT
jgi:hypothetical protein